jgi:hypothetical protein
MVQPKIYKGIEYVQFSELPLEQQELLKSTMPVDFTIKILVNEKILRDCIQFKDYFDWYENVFKVKHLKHTTVEVKQIKNQEAKQLILNKA